ncbi:MAG TPA: S9 family peptidase [Thermomicrobiales bacterium]|nr:S9 family peptidase [Thermomicrobiales bacterium]
MPTPEPISFDRLADRQYPREPRISPDGTAVAMTVMYASKKDDRATSQIWLSRNHGEPFPFTGGKAGAADPGWSPDGSCLVFTSSRDDKDERAGLFVIPADGGEAQQIGDVRGEIAKPRWSPDGSCIAFLMRDPETEAEKKDKEAKRDQVVVEEEPKHQRLWVIDPDTGKRRCLTTGNRSVRDYAWAPDGQELVVITTELPTANSLFMPSRVARVPVAGGLEHEITTFPTAPSTPVVRDVRGEQVVAVIDSDHRADPSPSIWIAPWDGGERRNILPELRGAVYDIVADPTTPDRVLAVIVEGVHGRLYSVSLETDRRELLSPGTMREHGSISAGISASRDGNHVAFVWTASDEPEEVWTIDRNGSTEKVTSFGKPFEGGLAPGEVVRWQSFDGVEIEGVLVRPARAEGPLPLFVEVHGGPSWQWEDRVMLDWHDWAQMLATRGWAVLMPNPRGSTGYGSAFEKLLQDDVGGGESKDLIAGAEAMVERGIADRDRLAIAGWSWGGYLTARTITQTRRFRAAVMGAGIGNLASDHGAGDIPHANTLYYPSHPYDEGTWEFYAKGTPIREASQVATPTLILHGDSDDRVHPTQGQEFFRALQHAGVPVQFVRYPREEHSIREREHQIDLMERIVTWLNKWVLSPKR